MWTTAFATQRSAVRIRSAPRRSGHSTAGGLFTQRFTSPASGWVVARLRPLSGSEVCAILGRHGFSEVRRRGSHIVMQKRLEGSTITVPVPDHKELRRGTLSAIIRQSEVPRTE